MEEIMETNASGVVLICDDHPGTLEAVAELVRQAHFTVHTAQNHDETLAAIEALKPDLLLYDIQMANRDGADIAAELKAHDSHFPMVAMGACESHFYRVYTPYVR